MYKIGFLMQKGSFWCIIWKKWGATPGGVPGGNEAFFYKIYH